MNLWDELLERIRTRKAQDLGPLSIAAGVELDDAISKDPQKFITTAEDRAFYMFVQLMDTIAVKHAAFEGLEDEDFYQKRTQWLTFINQSCTTILATDPHCTDAKTLQILSEDYPPERTFELLDSHAVKSISRRYISDAWENIYARPSLRARAAASRAMLETARYSQAIRTCETLIRSDQADHVGARYTLALAYARLELEEQLEALEASYHHRSIASVALGAGREKKEDSIDYSAGIVLAKKTGDAVQPGDLLATLYAANEDLLDAAENIFMDALDIRQQKAVEAPLFHARVSREGVERFDV